MVTLRNNSHEIKKVLALVFKRVRKQFPKAVILQPGSGRVQATSGLDPSGSGFIGLGLLG